MVDYNELSECLRFVLEKPTWQRSLRSMRKYVANYDSKIGFTVSQQAKTLIEFGREHPEEFEKLMELGEKIKANSVNVDLYIEQNKEAIEKAMEYITSLQRPISVINSVIKAANDKNRSPASYLRDGKKVLQVLLPIAKSSMTRFRSMVDDYLKLVQAKDRLSKNSYQRNYRKRRSMQVELFAYLKRLKYVDEKHPAWLAFMKQEEAKARAYVEAAKAEGVKALTAREDYWREYLADLEDTLKVIESEKRGAKIFRDKLAFPNIVYKSSRETMRGISSNKLSALQEKFSKK